MDCYSLGGLSHRIACVQPLRERVPTALDARAQCMHGMAKHVEKVAAAPVAEAWQV